MRFNPLCVIFTLHLHTFHHSVVESNEEIEMLIQNVLTHFNQCWFWHRNQSLDLHAKTIDLFLYEMQHQTEMRENFYFSIVVEYI